MVRRKVEINMKYTTHEQMQELYHKTFDTRLKIRYLAMLKFMEGNTSLAVAKMLYISDATVREWLNRYNQFGLDGLLYQRPKGAECKLTVEQLNKVAEALQQSPRDHGFNKSNWTMSLLKKWISREFHVNYVIESLYDLVHRIGFSMQRPKKQCKNADPEKQTIFKKELQEMIETSNDDTVILYEDEAIVTNEPTVTRKWALKGEQPIVSTNSKGFRQRRVIFGACDPKTGDVYYSTKEAGNSESFEDFLKQAD